MSRLTRALVATVLIALVAIVLVPAGRPAKAQGGLTDEQKALLDRIVSASQKVDEYTSYVRNDTSTQSMVIDMSMMGLGITMNSTQELTSTTTFIAGEGDAPDNIGMVAALVVTEQSNIPGQESDNAYTLNAEVRSVDGTVYIMASYADSRGTVAPLPEGWVELPDANAFEGVFSELDLDAFFPDDEEQNPLEDRELLERAVGDVTVESTTLEDGTAVDVITITFSPAGFADILNEMGTMPAPEENPFVGAMLDQLLSGEASAMTAVVTLGADDTPVSLAFDMTLGIAGVQLDVSTLDPENVPPGLMATINFTISFGASASYSDINSPDLTPVEAPEM